MTGDSPVYDAIRRRRAVREYEDTPVKREEIDRILRAVRWAPSAGNRRLHKVIVIQDRAEIVRVRAISPGLFGDPPLLLVLCTDDTQLEKEGVKSYDTSTMVDVGTTAMCMMLAAHELGSERARRPRSVPRGVRGALNIPEHLTPDFHPPGRPRETAPAGRRTEGLERRVHALGRISRQLAVRPGPGVVASGATPRR